MNELDFKIKLSEFFLKNWHGIFNFEFPFEYNRRRCDILYLTTQGTIGIEIKSDIDNLSNLDKQLTSYDFSFNYVYVACGDRFVSEIKKKKGRFGIIHVSDNDVNIIRKAKIRKRLNIDYILDMCDKALLEYISGIKSQNKGVLINKIKSSFNADTIASIHLEALKQKIEPIYNAFERERGKNISQDDIILLSLKSTKLAIN